MNITEVGHAESEKLRPARAFNYHIKFDVYGDEFGPMCQRCNVRDGLLVTRLSEGDTDDCFSVRCRAHMEGTPTPGQWVERQESDA